MPNQTGGCARTTSLSLCGDKRSTLGSRPQQDAGSIWKHIAATACSTGRDANTEISECDVISEYVNSIDGGGAET